MSIACDSGPIEFVIFVDSRKSGQCPQNPEVGEGRGDLLSAVAACQGGRAGKGRLLA